MATSLTIRAPLSGAWRPQPGAGRGRPGRRCRLTRLPYPARRPRRERDRWRAAKASSEVAAAAEITASAEVAAAAPVAATFAATFAVAAAGVAPVTAAPAEATEAAERLADEQAGQEAAGAAAEVAAVPRAVIGGRAPERHRPVVDQHFPALRLDAAAHLGGADRAGRHLARGAARRRPGHVLDRGAVPGVEEAGRPPLRQRLALQQRLGRRHREAPLLEGRADRGHLLGPAGPVVGVGRLLVGIDRGGVMAHRLGIDAGHPRVDVERADVLAERDQILLRQRLDLRQLLLTLAPPAPRAEDQGAAPDDRQDQDRDQQHTARPAAGAALLRGVAAGG